MDERVRRWTEPPDLPATHYVDNRIYTDPGIFAEEQAAIFAKCWRLVAHVSEFANVGDYRTVEIAGVPILIVKGKDGEIRAFYNICAHRGAPLVRDERGNAEGDFVCLYHLWSYGLDGQCTGITRQEGYDACGLTAADVTLRPVRAETKFGLVFVCLDDDAEPLADFLGPMADHLEEHLGQDELEVFHYHRAEMKTNWKLFADNDGEQYHEFLHILNRRTGIIHPEYHERRWRLYPNAHNVMMQGVLHYEGYGLDVRGQNTMPGMQPNGFIVMLLFPDVMVNIRATVMRIDTMTPIAPDRTLVEWRGVGLKSDTDELREMRIRHHNQVWGPAGRNLPEDTIAVETQYRNMASGAFRYSIFAREEELRPQDDSNLRAFYQEWGRRVGRSPHDPFAPRDDERAIPRAAAGE